MAVLNFNYFALGFFIQWNRIASWRLWLYKPTKHQCLNVISFVSFFRPETPEVIKGQHSLKSKEGVFCPTRISITFNLHLWFVIHTFALALWNLVSLFVVRQLQIPGYSHMLHVHIVWTIYFSDYSRWTLTFWKRALQFTSERLFWFLSLTLKGTSTEKWHSICKLLLPHWHMWA